jgi:hypothetical protein
MTKGSVNLNQKSAGYPRRTTAASKDVSDSASSVVACESDMSDEGDFRHPNPTRTAAKGQDKGKGGRVHGRLAREHATVA